MSASPSCYPQIWTHSQIPPQHPKKLHGDPEDPLSIA
jgi:hypothetical protein